MIKLISICMFWSYAAVAASVTTITADQIKSSNGTKLWIMPSTPGTLSVASATVTSVGANAPLVSSGGLSPVISIPQATSIVDGYLSAADWSVFNSKEPSIASGTIAQYWRGDKTFQNLDTSVVPELTNLYYTNARGIGSILNGFVSSPGTVTASDSIISAIQKIDGNVATLSGSAITSLSGDGTAVGPGASILTLATVNSNPGSFGSASNTLIATVSGKGLITSLSSTPISIAESQVVNLVSDLAGKEPSIATGTVSQYWRGDKTFQTLDTLAVPENTNLYFTNSRAINSVLTGFVASSGTVTASDSILTAIQELAGNATSSVIGPATASNNALARFNGATGKLIKNSGIFLSDSNDVTGANSVSITNANVAVTMGLNLKNNSTSSTSGNSIEWHGNNSIGNDFLMGDVYFRNSSNTSGSESSDFFVRKIQAGVYTDFMRFGGNGRMSYGGGGPAASHDFNSLANTTTIPFMRLNKPGVWSGNMWEIWNGSTALASFNNNGLFTVLSQTVNGVTGAGFIQYNQQSATPATPVTSFRLFADATNRFSILNTGGRVATFDSAGLTANRVYTLPNATGTLALTTTEVQQVPSGLVNGVNTTYTLANTPVSSASVKLYIDGLFQRQGTDYTISGTTITVTPAPTTGQTLDVNYAF